MVEAGSIEKELTVHGSPRQVWDAVATTAGLAGWFGDIEVEPRLGGVTTFGSVIAWDPFTRFATRTPTDGDEPPQTMEFFIEPGANGSSVLRFVHSGEGAAWESDVAVTSAGWDMYMATLRAYLEHFAGRAVTFVPAEARSGSMADDAWPTLLSGLGLTTRVRAGDEVRLTPEGMAPIDGVVDYARTYFLGVRTPDALYRFHNRIAVRLPIAVGHHLYSGDVDREAHQRAWKGWLDSMFTGDE